MENYKKVSLFADPENTCNNKPESLPLVLPNNVVYNKEENRYVLREDSKRTHWEIVASTAQLLTQIQGPIAVLTISGMARSGKSYLLSRVLGTSDSFSLGHSMEPETFGIWIATKVLKCDQFTVILVDTEGVDATSAEKRNDFSLLVLTVLLSSYFIFNTISVPTKTQLENLECFVHLANSLRVKEEGDDDCSNFSKVFPDFLWLLRDVTLAIKDDRGNEIDAKTYLTEKLLKTSGKFQETKSDKVSRAIKHFFPSLDCRTLPIPSDDPTIMRNVENNTDKLTAKFNHGIEQLVEHILRNLKAKTGFQHGSKVSGGQLVCMLESYVGAVNAPDNIPIIETSWKTSLRLLADRDHQQAVQVYHKNMTDLLEKQGDAPLEDIEGDAVTFHEAHQRFYKKAQEVLRENLAVMSNELELLTFMNRLQNEIIGSKGSKKGNSVGLYHEFWQRNYDKSLTYCQKLKDELYAPISKKLAEHRELRYTYNDLKEDLKKLEEAYKEGSKGPAKQHVYGEFMEFLKSKERAFAQIDGFEKEEFAERQRRTQFSLEIERMSVEQEKIEKQMMAEFNENKKQAELLKNEFDGKIDKMKGKEREMYLELVNKQADMMQKKMIESVEIMKTIGENNKEMIGKQMEIMATQREEDRERIKTMIDAVHERNEKITQDIVQQVSNQKKNPLDKVLDFVSSVVPIISMVKPLFSIKK